MTIYSAIADSDVDPESPGTTNLFTRLRDNPLAIQEDDATAPDNAYATLAGTITSQGALATLNTVSASEIDAGAVGAQTAALSLYDIGSYVFARSALTTTTAPGATIAGTNLHPAGVTYADSSGNPVELTSTSAIGSGTWRCMGYAFGATTGGGGSTVNEYSATLWLRVS
jgi:hypothetical protein